MYWRMQKQLAVLSLSEVCQDTVLHLLSSLYPTHRKITAGKGAMPCFRCALPYRRKNEPDYVRQVSIRPVTLGLSQSLTWKTSKVKL